MPYELIRSNFAEIDRISQISGGGEGGTYDSGTITEESAVLESAGDTIIAAGAYKVKVVNRGFEDISVTVGANTRTLKPGDPAWELEYAINKTNSTQDFCPEVTITLPADAKAFYQAFRPSV